MNVLDSPLEALAFNYATFGFSTLLNNLWAWVAVLTAALSLWKIRAKSHLPPPPPSCSGRSLNGPDSTEHQRPLEPFVPPEAPGTSRPAVVAAGDGNVDGVTKGKFTVYYEDDSECEVKEKEEEELLTETEECDGGCKSEWWESWDKMLKLKRGESGWYKNQDLTELNGNVVRLWDDAGFGVANGSFPKEARYSSIAVWCGSRI